MSTDSEKKRGEKSRPKIKTMEEFSAASGISRATVSKYFNDPDSVLPTTRERIEKATKKLRYRPISLRSISTAKIQRPWA